MGYGAHMVENKTTSTYRVLVRIPEEKSHLEGIDGRNLKWI
jgi:hypothetical protein